MTDNKIDESLYKKPEDKYCSFCGAKLNAKLVYTSEKYNTETGEKDIGWGFSCPNQTTNTCRDRHNAGRVNSFRCPVEKKDQPKKQLYDIIIYYKVQDNMEHQEIIDTTEPSNYTNESYMRIFTDTVKNKIIAINASDVLRIDIIENK